MNDEMIRFVEESLRGTETDAMIIKQYPTAVAFSFVLEYLDGQRD